MPVYSKNIKASPEEIGKRQRKRKNTTNYAGGERSRKDSMTPAQAAKFMRTWRPKS